MNRFRQDPFDNSVFPADILVRNAPDQDEEEEEEEEKKKGEENDDEDDGEGYSE